MSILIMEIIMKVKNLFSYIIFTTALPLSVSYGMNDDMGVHRVGHRVPQGDMYNSAPEEIKNSFKPYREFAVHTSEVHGMVADAVRQLRDLLSSMANSRLLTKSAGVREARESLQYFFNTSTYNPTKNSSGLKAAMGSLQWSALEFIQSSIQARFVEPTPSRYQVGSPVWQAVASEEELDSRAQRIFSQGEESLQEFITYTGKLDDFLDRFHTAIAQAIVTVKQSPEYSETSKADKSFLSFLEAIRSNLNDVRHAYSIQAEEGIFKFPDVITFLNKLCLLDPAEHADATIARFEQLRKARADYAKSMKERTDTANRLIDEAWMLKTSPAAGWAQDAAGSVR